MPQRALLDGRPVFAFDVTAEVWPAHRGYSREHRLVMPCCGVRAVPKTSPRGLQFYAHAFKHSCGPGAFVSYEHEVLKAEAALAVRSAGWDATTEHAEGGWHVDVLATRRGARVGFEIRLTRQDLGRTLERQEALRDAGVRAAWFVRRPPAGYSPSRELPLFILPDADLEAQKTAVRNLVDGLLNRRLRFVPPGLERRVPLQLAGEHLECPGCAAAWFATPVVLERYDAFGTATARARQFDEADIRLLRSHRERTGRRLGWYDRQRGRLCCPECRRPHESALIPQLAAQLWPETGGDGHLTIRGGYYTAGWTEEPPPAFDPGPIAALGTEAEWRAVLAAAQGRAQSMDRPSESGWGPGGDAGAAASEREDRALIAELRLKMMRDVAPQCMPDDAVDAWLSALLPGVGTRPIELAQRDSDAVRKVEVALGLRDPLTNRPLRW